MPDAATLATLHAAGFEIISSKFVTRLQEQVAELQQRNADLTTSLNEELAVKARVSAGRVPP